MCKATKVEFSFGESSVAKSIFFIVLSNGVLQCEIKVPFLLTCVHAMQAGKVCAQSSLVKD